MSRASVSGLTLPVVLLWMTPKPEDDGDRFSVEMSELSTAVDTTATVTITALSPPLSLSLPTPPALSPPLSLSLPTTSTVGAMITALS